MKGFTLLVFLTMACFAQANVNNIIIPKFATDLSVRNFWALSEDEPGITFKVEKNYYVFDAATIKTQCAREPRAYCKHINYVHGKFKKAKGEVQFAFNPPLKLERFMNPQEAADFVGLSLRSSGISLHGIEEVYIVIEPVMGFYCQVFDNDANLKNIGNAIRCRSFVRNK